MATPPDFTAGAVLTAAQMNAVGLWLVKTQAIGTAVATVVVSDCFSADYESYRVVVSGGAASGATSLTMSLGASTASYYYGGTIVTYSTGAVTGTAGNNVGSWVVGAGTSANLHADVSLNNVSLAEISTYHAYDGNPVSQARNWSGVHNVATAYTEFTLGCTGGATMTGGTIRVYGYKA
jgi:hypothetical protein